MSAVSPGDVRIFLKGFIQRRLAAQGQDPLDELPDDCDLLLSGIIDSLGLLELVTAVNEHYGQEIDFENLDPEQMTIVGPLIKFVSEQLSTAL
jgi:acyl carrier protein